MAFVNHPPNLWHASAVGSVGFFAFSPGAIDSGAGAVPCPLVLNVTVQFSIHFANSSVSSVISMFSKSNAVVDDFSNQPPNVNPSESAPEVRLHGRQMGLSAQWVLFHARLL